jgi:hypothetical protein
VFDQVDPGLATGTYSSLGAHRALIDFSTCFRVTNDPSLLPYRRTAVLPDLRPRRLEMLSHSGGIERARQAKRPRDRPTSLGEIEAVRVGMY